MSQILKTENYNATPWGGPLLAGIDGGHDRREQLLDARAEQRMRVRALVGGRQELQALAPLQ